MTTATDILTATVSNMQRLAKTYKVKDKCFEAIANQSGVSFSMVKSIYYGARANPSVKILDRVTASVNVLLERR